MVCVTLTYAGFQELAAYSLVHANSLSHLLHISTGGFAQSTDAVDTADPLGQESIGRLHIQYIRFNFLFVYRNKKGQSWIHLCCIHSSGNKIGNKTFSKET